MVLTNARDFAAAHLLGSGLRPQLQLVPGLVALPALGQVDQVEQVEQAGQESQEGKGGQTVEPHPLPATHEWSPAISSHQRSKNLS